MLKLIVSTNGYARETYGASSRVAPIPVPTVKAINYGRITGSIDRDEDSSYAHVTLTVEQARGLIATLALLVAEAEHADAVKAPFGSDPSGYTRV